MRPLEVAAQKAGVSILLEHRMVALQREAPDSGRVIGVTVEHDGVTLNIRARKAVIIATGGSTGNVNFRRMFDPRLTEEYCGLAGMPWSDQDASGEIAAMAIGASLWGLYNRSVCIWYGGRPRWRDSRHLATPQNLRLPRRHTSANTE
jgi:succinate dehydrogenase/fumarate reductase flavoprotein subunit